MFVCARVPVSQSFSDQVTKTNQQPTEPGGEDDEEEEEEEYFQEGEEIQVLCVT